MKNIKLVEIALKLKRNVLSRLIFTLKIFKSVYAVLFSTLAILLSCEGDSSVLFDVEREPLGSPANFQARAESGQVILNWDAVEGSVMYNIYRDNSKIDDTTKTSYTDTGLTNGKTYNYQVSAVDEFDVEWDKSSINATPLPDPPPAPQNVEILKGDSRANLSWDEVANASYYKIYRDGAITPIADNVTGLSYTDSGLTNGTTYTYQVSAVDKYDQEGSKSIPGSVRPLPPRPNVPEGVETEAAENQITLSWNAVTKASYYRIYRDGATIPIADDVTGLRYMDSGLENGTTYNYRVSAVIDVGSCGVCILEGPKSDPIVAIPGRPISGAPGNLSVSLRDREIRLTWSEVTDADRYRIYRDGATTAIADIAETSYTDTGLIYGRMYSYEVSAVNASGEESDKSHRIEVTPLPEPLSAPENVQISRGDTQVELMWDMVINASYYRIYRNGNPIPIADNVIVLHYVDTGLTNGTTYNYEVTSVDEYGQEGNKSSFVEVIPLPDPPSVPQGLNASEGNTQIELSWNAVTNASYYRIYRDRDPAPIADNVTVLRYVDMGLTNGITYNYRVSAVIDVGSCGVCKVEGPKSEESIAVPTAVSIRDMRLAYNAAQYVDTRYFTGRTIAPTEGGSILPDSDISHMFAGAASPFGMVAISPVNTHSSNANLNNYNAFGRSRYKWGNYPQTAAARSRIKGFTTTAVSGMGCYGDLALDFPFMVYPGDQTSKKLQIFAGDSASDFLAPLVIKNSDFSANTIGRPGYFKATFSDEMIAEVVANKRTGIAQFTLPASQDKATFFFTTASRMVRNMARIEKNIRDSKTVIQLTIQNRGFCENVWGNYTIYMVAELEQTASNINQARAIRLGPASSHLYQLPLLFELSGTSGIIRMKFGLSYINHDGAYANLKAEISDWDFSGVRRVVQENWNDILGRIRIEDAGASTRIKEIFYTSLYRALLHPDIFSDTNDKYRGFNESIYDLELVGSRKRAQYQLFSGWDTYRAQMQLITLLAPDISADMAQSLINNSKQADCDEGTDVDKGNCPGGSFTRWGVANDDSAVMSGEPGAIIVANTLAFGATEFNLDEAIGAMERGNQNRSSRNKANNINRGEDSFFPRPLAGNWGSYRFSYNLELAAANFSKAAFSQFVKLNRADLGLTNTEGHYSGKATNFYRKYNENLVFANRNLSNDLTSGGFFIPNAGFDFTSIEGTDAQYIWMLPMNANDIPNRFSTKIERWYNWLPTSKRESISTDDSNEVKRYKRAISALNDHVSSLNAGFKSQKLWFGNEPVHFNPFVYNFLSVNDQAQEASKSQDTVRKILEDMFNNSIDRGIPGNDDLGCLTAWYVWGAMGLYPAVPGVGVYTITAPLFKKITIDKHYDIGSIIINAPEASEGKSGKRYITDIEIKKGIRAKETYNKTYIRHTDLYSGSDIELIFALTDDESRASRTLKKSPSFSDLASIENFLQANNE